MKRRILQFISSLVILPVLAFAMPVVSAAPVDVVCNSTTQNSPLCANTNAAQNDIFDVIQLVINLLLMVVGVVAVIMIIFGGFRYVISNGDANATKAARDTILYAVIGLIVAGLAYVIVNFVITRFI